MHFDVMFSSYFTFFTIVLFFLYLKVNLLNDKQNRLKYVNNNVITDVVMFSNMCTKVSYYIIYLIKTIK